MDYNEDIITDEERKQYKLRSAAAKRILAAMKHDYGRFTKKTKDFQVARVSYCTGVSVMNICKYIQTKPKDVINLGTCEAGIKNNIVPVINYIDMKYRIHDQYVNKQIIPSKKLLVNIFKGLKSRYTMETLQNDLKIHGFVEVNIPNTNKCMVTEKVDQIFHRQQFFKTIIKFRENYSNKNIIILEERVIKTELTEGPPDMTSLMNYVFFASTVHGLKIKCYHKICILDAYQDFVTSVLSCESSDNNLIVTRSKKYMEAICPNESSTAKEMMEWLEQNQIPVPELSSRSRYHLYQIIKMFKNKKSHNKSEIERFLSNLGFAVAKYTTPHFGMLYESCFFKNTFKEVSKLIAKQEVLNETSIDILNEMIKDLTLNYNTREWERMNRNAMNIERVKLRQDVDMETVIDQILTMAKYGNIDPDDIKDLDDYIPKPKHREPIIYR